MQWIRTGGLVAALALYAGIALAQPQVTGVGGDVVHQEQVTITGTGFGLKVPAAPMVWDDFEGGTPGERVNEDIWYTWSIQTDKRPEISDARVRTPGTQSCLQDFTEGNYNSTLGLVRLDDSKLFVSGWFYNTVSGADSRNVKILSVRGGSPGNWDPPNIRSDIYPTTHNGHIYAADCDDTKMADDWSLSGNLYSGAWHRLDAWIDPGTPNTPNGEYTLWRDLDVWAEIAGTFRTGSCTLNNLYLMSYFATDTGSPRPQMEWYWDQLYIDDTPARVEIGDRSTWNACTHREIQVPVDWGNDSIVFTANRGSFAVGDSAFVYVVNADGTPASAGFPVYFAASGGASDDPPTVDIQSPADGYETDQPSISLSGVASDDAGLQTIRWINGAAEGTVDNDSGDWAQWSAASVPLLSGTNHVRVLAMDTSGQVAADVIVVTYTVDEGPPGQPGQPTRLEP